MWSQKRKKFLLSFNLSHLFLNIIYLQTTKSPSVQRLHKLSTSPIYRTRSFINWTEVFLPDYHYFLKGLVNDMRGNGVVSTSRGTRPFRSSPLCIVSFRVTADRLLEAVDENFTFCPTTRYDPIFCLADFSPLTTRSQFFRAFIILLYCYRLFMITLSSQKLTCKSHCVYLYLLSRRLCFHFVCQRLRCRRQINICR